MKKVLIPFVLCLVLILPGCKSTQLVSVWRDANANQKYSNLAVIAMIKENSARTIIEEQIVEVFESNGIRMSKGNIIVNEDTNVDPKVVEQALRDKGIDAVLILKPIGVDRDVMVDAPVGYYMPYPGWGTYFYGSYPATVYTNTTFKIESDLYDVASNKMVWSAQTSTLNPGDVQTIGQGVGNAVVSSLQESDFIVLPKKKQ